MKFILTASIRKAEFEPLQKIFSLEVIKIAARKCLEGLGTKIKSSKKISSTILKKIPLTGTGGAGRATFLLQIVEDRAILVMLRLKNDKKVGENMSVNNTKFKKVFDKNLDLLMDDIKNDDYEEFEL
ncbi:MAG: hypothetical protein ABID64_03660 [Nitrospirota bacterium]